MNSKLVLAIIAGVVVAGGLLAIRNLTSTEDTVEVVDARDNDSESSDGGTTIRSIGGSTAISTMDESQARTRTDRAPAGRTFNRGEGAVALQVTPATTSTRTRAVPTTTTITEEQRAENREIADLVNLFRDQTDPEARIDIADELGQIDSPDSIRQVLELLKTETDPEVRVALLEAMQGLDALEETGPDVYKAVTDMYGNLDDSDARIAAQDLMGDLATQESADALRAVVSSAEDPYERLNATENLMRIKLDNPDAVSAEEVTAYTAQLKQDYETGPDAAYRGQAIMALATDGAANLEFFQHALTIEQDPNLVQLLESLVRLYTQTAPQAPPPGTQVTPVPTPDVE